MSSELSINQLSNMNYDEVIRYFECRKNFPANTGNISIEGYVKFLLKETVLCDI